MNSLIKLRFSCIRSSKFSSLKAMKIVKFKRKLIQKYVLKLCYLFSVFYRFNTVS